MEDSGVADACLMRHTEQRNRGTEEHVTRHTSHVTRHTSHITRHTSHITHHTSHVNTCLLHEQLAQPTTVTAHGAYDGLQAFVADFVVGQHENLGRKSGVD